MSIAKEFFEARKSMLDHVGFNSRKFIFDCGGYMVQDCTNMFWSCGGKILKRAESVEELEDRECLGMVYKNVLHPKEFQGRSIYRGKSSR